MDIVQTAWILVVIAVLVGGDGCPYVDPQIRFMTCIKDLPSVRYRPVNASKHQHGGGSDTHAGRRRKRSRIILNDTEVNLLPPGDEPPPSTPDMTTEFINFFCSENGIKIVRCSKDLFEKCSSHPSLRRPLLNPELAVKAQSFCDRYVKRDFKGVMDCVNESMLSKSVEACVKRAYSGYMQTDGTPTITKQTHSCRATAESYNCFVNHIGTRCGRRNVGFIVAIIRSMEPRECRHLVDTTYKDPLLWPPPKVSFSVAGTSTRWLHSGLVMAVCFILSLQT